MKPAIALLALCLFACSPTFAQQQIDSASKEDVEQLLQVTGARDRIQQMWTAMAQQAATMAADAYQRKHPNATPLEIRKVAEVAGQATQNAIKVLSVEELIDAMIPIYERHLTHSDVRAMLEFYNSPVGQKVLKEMPAMMAESMQAVQPILRKHLPELEAQAEAAAADANKPAETEPK